MTGGWVPFTGGAVALTGGWVPFTGGAVALTGGADTAECMATVLGAPQRSVTPPVNIDRVKGISSDAPESTHDTGPSSRTSTDPCGVQ